MELLLLPLQAMALVLITAPPLALLPAALFAWLFTIERRPICMTAAIFWLVYALYESGMWLRLLCSGECNIRIDLLVAYPLLLVVSLIAVIVFWRARRRARG